MANRYKDQSAANEIGMEAIDAGFLGVNTQLDPGLLKTGAAYSDVNQVLAGPGLCSHARNMRFRRGVAETRQGTVAPTWCNPRNPDVGTYPASGHEPLLFRFQSDVYNVTQDMTGVLVSSPTQTMWLYRDANDANGKAQYVAYTDNHVTYQVFWNGVEWEFKKLDAIDGDATYATGTGGDFPWEATWSTGTVAYASEYQAPWTERILAAAQFADPDGTESLMLVFPSAIYQCREGIAPIRIGLPAETVLQEPVELLQTFNSMVLLRGFDEAPLAWDGSADEFAPIPAADPNGSYTASIPNSETGAVMSNRLLLVSGRDTIAVSDILTFTRYDNALNEFRINTGEDDAITGIFPFRRTNLLVFKSQSVHLISNVSGDLSNIAAEIVNSEIGCPAPRSIAAVGGDVYFLSDDGIFRLSEVVEQSMQVQERPVSEPIDSLIKRINWNAVDKCWATVHGDYYRLAVPLDGATRCNAVLVYDTVRQAWQGYDDYPDDFRPDILGRTNSLGRKHAYAIDRENAVVAILDQGATDAATFALTTIDQQKPVRPYPAIIKEEDITSEIQTRGYILLDDGPKRFRHGMVTLETWNPSYTIDIVTDGYNEIETVVGPRTKDRTKYYLHGKADYDTTNTNQDFDVAKREDYSVIIPAAGVDLDIGIRPAQMQQCQEQFVVRRTGQWAAIKVVNTRGRLALKNSSMDGQNRRNMARTFA